MPPHRVRAGMWIMPLGNQGQVDSGRGFTSFLTDSKNLDMAWPSPERQLLSEITSSEESFIRMVGQSPDHQIVALLILL